MKTIIKKCKICKQLKEMGCRNLICDDCNNPKEIICDNCGKIFMPSIYQYRQKIKGFKVGCCTSCSSYLSSEKTKNTIIERYGSDYYSNHTKNYWNNVSDEDLVKRNLKTKQTKLELHGNANYVNVEKIRETQFKKYGCYGFNTDKQKDTMIKKYGVDHNFKRKDVIEKLNERKWNDVARIKRNEKNEEKQRLRKNELEKFINSIIDFSNEFKRTHQRLPHLNDALKYFENTNAPIKARTSLNWFVTNYNLRSYFIIKESYFEKIVEDWLVAHNIAFKRHDRNIIKPLELDFYLPDYKIAIEVNDTNTHNCTTSSYAFKPTLSPTYHYDKTIKCLNKNVHLIHIFEKDLVNLDVTLSALLPKDVIYARQCVIKECCVKDFFNSYHRQGYGHVSKGFGLFYNNELIQAMSFRKVRNKSKADFELYRLASKSNIVVVGGASKLLKYWENNHHNCTLLSYCDLTYNTGNVYTKLGFKFSHYSGVNYKWVKNNEWLSRESCQRHKLEHRFNVKFDSSLTENDIMSMNSYVKVYDCGNNVYVKNIN